MAQRRRPSQIRVRDRVMRHPRLILQPGLCLGFDPNSGPFQLIRNRPAINRLVKKFPAPLATRHREQCRRAAKMIENFDARHC